MMVSIWRFQPSGNNNIESINLDSHSSSLNQASENISQGGYTTFRTYGKTDALHLDDHLARLQETARLSGHNIQVNWDQLRSAIRQALAVFPASEARVRLTVDLVDEPGTIFIMLEPLSVPPAEDYMRGVAVTTSVLHRENPLAKLTGFIRTASAIRHAAPEGIEEVLMIGEDGRVLEGLTSNFFAFYKGEIWTAEQGILRGITRSIVLDECQIERLRMRFEGFPFADIPGLSEAFITSSSRAVLPVIKIDHFQIGNGFPGPVANTLLERYQKRVSLEIQPI
jgi:branched-chain amino acid aminotransferase